MTYYRLIQVPVVFDHNNRAMVYAKLEHAGANRPMIAEVAQLHPVQASLDPAAIGVQPMNARYCLGYISRLHHTIDAFDQPDRVEPTAPSVKEYIAPASPGLLDIARFWTKRRVILLVVKVDEVTVWVRTFTAVGLTFGSG